MTDAEDWRNPFDEVGPLGRHLLLRRGDRDDYRLYLESDVWRALRLRLITERGRACERCGRHYLAVLDVHHLTYLRIGYELDDDLVVLCRTCHAHEHGRLAA